MKSLAEGFVPWYGGYVMDVVCPSGWLFGHVLVSIGF
jgi:hypothetical protein